MGFFWEMYQQSRIGAAAAAAERAVDRAERARDQSQRASRDLETKIESLTLTTMAMWSLLSEKLGVSEQELADRVREIDLRDGKLDGKVVLPPAVCSSCGRTSSAKRDRCIYCGWDRRLD